MKKKHKDLIISVFIVAVCVFLYHNTYQIPSPRFEPLGSAFFPRFILAGIILLSLMLMVKRLFFDSKSKGQDETDNKIGDDTSDHSGIRYALGVIFIFGVYILLISITDLPYLPLTFFFILGLGWFLALSKTRALQIVLAAAVSVTLIIYLVFGRLLGTFFP
jgi:hypothetical protein